MTSDAHKQKIVMPLAEALELGSRVIKTRGMAGITGNQSNDYHYSFLDAPDILIEFPNKLSLSQQDSGGYNREYVIGDDKIGGSIMPANIVIRCTYTNNKSSTKRVRVAVNYTQ